jgi:hypothetical protein
MGTGSWVGGRGVEVGSIGVLVGVGPKSIGVLVSVRVGEGEASPLFEQADERIKTKRMKTQETR